MKKIILTIAAVGLITATACKKEEVKTTDNAVIENGTTEMPPVVNNETAANVGGVEVPKFSNPDVQQFANEYAEYVNESMAAAKSGDAAKVQELTAKSQEWSAKQSALGSKMTPEDAKLFSDFSMKLVQAQQPQ